MLSVDRILTYLFRYSCQHSHFPPVHRPFQDDFNPMGTLYHAVQVPHPASVPYFSPGIFGAGPLDQ